MDMGQGFQTFLMFTSKVADSRLMWTLSGMLVCVKELWKITDKCPMSVLKWHGWLLCYLTRKCFPGVTVKSDKYNPIKSKHVSSIPKLMEKMNIDEGSIYDPEDLVRMFEDHDDMCVIYSSLFYNTHDIERYAEVNDEIFILIFDEVDDDWVIQETLQAYGHVFELRFISSTVSLDGDFKWNGKMFCRHGGDHHKSWWFMNRKDTSFLQTKDGSFIDVQCNLMDVCVYVRNTRKNMNLLRNEFMTYIGGQVKVQCYNHQLPLIVNCKTEEKCYQQLDGNNCFCNRKLYLKFPDLKCKSGLCRKCYGDAVGDDLVFIRPPIMGNDNVNSYADGFNSDCDDSNTSSRCIDESSDDELLEDIEEIQSCESETGGIDNEPGIIIPTENDNIEDFIVTGGNDDIPDENIDPEYFPLHCLVIKHFWLKKIFQRGNMLVGM